MNPASDEKFKKTLARSLDGLVDDLVGHGDRRAASAWVYTTVLVAWLEDHGLIRSWLRDDARPRLKRHLESGGKRLDWFAHAFLDLGGHPATSCLLDRRYNPAWEWTPTEDQCARILDFWTHAPDLHYPHGDGEGAQSITGWIAGDMLQLVGNERRKGNALVQTPRFVAEFLVERTVAPALGEFADVGMLRVMDPACGTGHLLVTAAEVLFAAYTTGRHGGAPVTPAMAARRVLRGLSGVELDPLTACVARLRLLVLCGAMLHAASRAEGPLRLHTLPADWRPRVACGNALLAGLGDPNPPGTILDDTNLYPGILARGTYHAVVANPPYITVKDPVAREAIRTAYRSVCHGKYPLSVPFTVLLFDLAIRGGEVRCEPRGHEQLDMFGGAA